jgi:ribosomal protein S2
VSKWFIGDLILMYSFYIVLNPTEEDIQLLLAAQCHIGAKNANTRMSPYIHKRRADGKLFFSI